MTFVGKIMVVLHLVMSVAFMAFAGAIYTAQVNWKTEAETRRKAAETKERKLEDEKAGLNKEKETLAQELAKFQDENTRLTAQKNSLETDLKSWQDKHNVLMASKDDTERLNQVSQQEIQERRLEASLQRVKNSELHKSRVEIELQRRKLEQELFSIQLKLTDAQERYADLLKENGKFRAFLAQKGLPTDPALISVTTAPPPPVEGIVLESRKAEKGNLELVEISIGGDDGLTRGHVLTIYRGDQYIGKLRIDYVTPDKSVGIVETKGKNKVIQKGDNVSTKL